jgi:hypothetical protein
LEAYLASCADAAIFSVGDRRKGFKPAGAEVGEDGDPDAGEAPLHWNFITATAISKVGLQIQRELLEERTIAYLIEWCDTPDIRCAGVAFTDISVMYDVDGNHVKLVKKSPDHNLYLMVQSPHPASCSAGRGGGCSEGMGVQAPSCSHQMPAASPHGTRHRTPFSLKREGSMVTGGVKRAIFKKWPA